MIESAWVQHKESRRIIQRESTSEGLTKIKIKIYSRMTPAR